MIGPMRRQHEHLATRVAAGGGGAVVRQRRWWDRTPLWWIAVLFAVGSTCFLLASLALLWASAPRPGIGTTFFAGSICFTAAAYLQHWLAVRAVAGRPALLLQCDSRRQTVDGVDVRYRHLVEQTPRIRRHRFEIAPLRFRIERTERE